MPSKMPLSPLIIGTRSNAVASPLRTSSTASSAVKPLERGGEELIGAARHRAAAGRERDAVGRRGLDACDHENIAVRPWRR